MKLPDFLESSELNLLRRKIGAELRSDLTVASKSRSRLIEDLDRILSTKGIDVAPEEIAAADDGTLIWRDPRTGEIRRVLVYIRDVNNYGQRQFLPRYHFAECRTLDDMRQKKRFGRYVVATREDGRFEIRIDGSDSTRELNVCQNCLDRIGWEGFTLTLERSRRLRLVEAFTPSRFFEKYPKSFIEHTPRHTAASAPPNDYSPDFSAKSQALRLRHGWACQKCPIVLSRIDERRFLHVHHINGQKNDDSDENLIVLCIRCHAEEPAHGQLKGMPDYKKFLTLYPT